MEKKVYDKSTLTFDTVKLQRISDGGCGNQGACNGK